MPSPFTDQVSDVLDEPVGSSDLLIQRLEAWRKAVSVVGSYASSVFSTQQSVTNGLEKQRRAVAEPPEFDGLSVQGGQGVSSRIAESGDIAQIFATLSSETETQIGESERFAQVVKQSIIPNLESLGADLDRQYKHVRTQHIKATKDIEKLRENTQKNIEYLGRTVATQGAPQPGKADIKYDPYLWNRRVLSSVQEQLARENTESENSLAIQHTFATLEQHIIEVLQQSIGSLAQLQGRYYESAHGSAATINHAFAKVTPSEEWQKFVQSNKGFLTPETGYQREADKVTYQNYNDPSTQPLIEGSLYRKGTYLKSSKPGHYVLTRAGFLHQYDSPDPSQDPHPVLSLYIPESEVSGLPARGSGDLSFKIISKDAGKVIASRHKYTFKATSYEELAAWYGAISKLSGVNTIPGDYSYASSAQESPDTERSAVASPAVGSANAKSAAVESPAATGAGSGAEPEAGTGLATGAAIGAGAAGAGAAGAAGSGHRRDLSGISALSAHTAEEDDDFSPNSLSRDIPRTNLAADVGNVNHSANAGFSQPGVAADSLGGINTEAATGTGTGTGTNVGKGLEDATSTGSGTGTGLSASGIGIGAGAGAGIATAYAAGTDKKSSVADKYAEPVSKELGGPAPLEKGDLGIDIPKTSDFSAADYAQGKSELPSQVSGLKHDAAAGLTQNSGELDPYPSTLDPASPKYHSREAEGSHGFYESAVPGVVPVASEVPSYTRDSSIYSESQPSQSRGNAVGASYEPQTETAAYKPEVDNTPNFYNSRKPAGTYGSEESAGTGLPESKVPHYHISPDKRASRVDSSKENFGAVPVQSPYDNGAEFSTPHTEFEPEVPSEREIKAGSYGSYGGGGFAGADKVYEPATGLGAQPAGGSDEYEFSKGYGTDPSANPDELFAPGASGLALNETNKSVPHVPESSISKANLPETSLPKSKAETEDSAQGLNKGISAETEQEDEYFEPEDSEAHTVATTGAFPSSPPGVVKSPSLKNVSEFATPSDGTESGLKQDKLAQDATSYSRNETDKVPTALGGAAAGGIAAGGATAGGSALVGDTSVGNVAPNAYTGESGIKGGDTPSAQGGGKLFYATDPRDFVGSDFYEPSKQEDIKNTLPKSDSTYDTSYITQNAKDDQAANPVSSKELHGSSTSAYGNKASKSGIEKEPYGVVHRNETEDYPPQYVSDKIASGKSYASDTIGQGGDGSRAVSGSNDPLATTGATAASNNPFGGDRVASGKSYASDTIQQRGDGSRAVSGSNEPFSTTGAAGKSNNPFEGDKIASGKSYANDTIHQGGDSRAVSGSKEPFSTTGAAGTSTNKYESDKIPSGKSQASDAIGKGDTSRANYGAAPGASEPVSSTGAAGASSKRTPGTEDGFKDAPGTPQEGGSTGKADMDAFAKKLTGKDVNQLAKELKSDPKTVINELKNRPSDLLKQLGQDPTKALKALDSKEGVSGWKKVTKGIAKVFK